ncbi:Hypothetical protein CINCED_3A005243 [Cinara cedri]|uniref:Uncharacterized protein n=1 Tax=Cinara cedri TaxID=506608 RepID=A0A5E4NJ91_9HEMI|nr:Hypothetical protein CINCED_3A005243 [Cinara cedri]
MVIISLNYEVLFISIICMVIINLANTKINIDFDLPKKYEISYKEYYFRSLVRFDQKKLDPIDFFMAFYNADSFRIPRVRDASQSQYEHYVTNFTTHITGFLLFNYNQIGIKLLDVIKILPTDDDRSLRTHYSEFHKFKTRKEFSEIEFRFVELIILKNILNLFGFSVTDYDRELKSELKNQKDSKKTIKTVKEFYLELKLEYKIEMSTKFIGIATKKQFEDIGRCDMDPVTKNECNQVANNIMSEERMRCIQSEFILKGESYFHYLLRMTFYASRIHYPLRFAQREFGEFLGDLGEDSIAHLEAIKIKQPLNLINENQ